jgi:hypothetical protein
VRKLAQLHNFSNEEIGEQDSILIEKLEVEDRNSSESTHFFSMCAVHRSSRLPFEFGCRVQRLGFCIAGRLCGIFLHVERKLICRSAQMFVEGGRFACTMMYGAGKPIEEARKEKLRQGLSERVKLIMRIDRDQT